MNEYKYKFSVVMPIYNVERYLEEAIESVVNQTIGFKENIQLILVNDGSPDNSEEICLKYKQKYPENIVYINQKNAGVSSARNNGMKYIEGKYVNFLDSDDKWATDAFEKVWSFFEKNEVDMAVGRKKFFEARNDYHPLDYKFKKTKVVDILEDYDYIHLHITSSFIKSEIAKQYKFNANLKYGEDAKYINEIILDIKKYGVIRGAKHYYRKRIDDSSAVQNKEKSVEWYTDTIKYFYKDLINKSIEEYGKVLPYIQYLIMYDIQWRIRKPIPEFIEEEIKKQYIEQMTEILQNIEDYIICQQRQIFSEVKIYILSLKYKRNIVKELRYKKGKLYFNNIRILKIRGNKSICKINILEIEDDALVMEGIINTPLPKEEYEVYLQVNMKELKPIQLEKGKKSIFTANDVAMERQIKYPYTYKIKIPLKDIETIRFVFMYKNEHKVNLTLEFGRFAKLSNSLPLYYAKDKYIVKYSNKKIIVNENTKENRRKREKEYCKKLKQENKKNIGLNRLAYFICKSLNKKEIWLISDREDRANDNGEHLFKYIVKQNNKNIKPYFVIDANSKDYKKMKKIGKVIKLGSKKHKMYFLLASKIISSQANDYVINAFGKKQQYYKDLYNFKFIFLQHGITKDDLSSWLKKSDKNIKLFVTATKPEYNSIVNGDYYYTEKEVKLTGFPRYDMLKDNKKKSIIILPTQRRALVEWNKSKEKSYNPFFKESECYKFYNDLIHDKRILEALKSRGYKLRFGLHPLHSKQSVDFEGNENIEILSDSLDFQKEFGENALLITDYSSVAFDFGYLKKPIIYTQFDKDTFYEGQVYEQGYFDYEEDGFGPVCYDYETTVKTILEYIQNECKMEDKYLKRIEKFYYKFDNNNCKRVYEEILKL